MVMEGLSHGLPQFLLHHSRNECSSLQCWMAAALFLGLSRLTGQLFLLFMSSLYPCPQCSQQVPGFLWHAWQLVLTKTTVSKYGTLWILDFWYKTTDSIPLVFVAWILLSAPIWKLQFSLLFEPCLIPDSCTSLLAFFLQHQPYSRPKWAYRHNTGELFLKANFSLKRLISLGALYSPSRET